MDKSVLEQQARYRQELRRTHAIRNAQLKAWWADLKRKVAGNA
jgi:hypothetical protein